MSAQHAPEPRELDGDGEPGTQQAERFQIENDRRAALGTIGLGALMVVLAVAVLVQAMQLPPATNGVGPATLMWVVGALLFIVGGMSIRAGRRDMGRSQLSGNVSGNVPGNVPGQDWLRMLALLGLLVLFAVALGWVGYVVSATFLFGTSAIVLGAPDRLRSFAYGWSIAVVVYLVFDTGIGLSLPAGPWGF